ncbi:MAG: pyridoxamine 5'-phosphate oxidase family protein [Bdellovibrionales bacterium]
MIDTNALLDIIFSNDFMVLATADAQGKPWASPVVYGCDDQMRFYWVSGASSRHAANHAARAETAAVIYDSHQPPGIVQGIYLEGVAEELDASSLASAAVSFYSWRYPDPEMLAGKIRRPDEFIAPSPRRMWRMKPSMVYALDPAGDPAHGNMMDHRIVVSLTEAFHLRFAQQRGTV